VALILSMLKMERNKFRIHMVVRICNVPQILNNFSPQERIST